MKRSILIYFFILFVFSNLFSQKGTIKVVKQPLTDTSDFKVLNGYFIIGSFSPKYQCKNFSLDSKIPQVQDCNFYEGISSISFVDQNDLDLNKIDDLKYRIQLQEKESYVYLSRNPLILLETNGGDSSILKKNDLFQRIQQNIITAELIERAIDTLKPDFTNDIHYYLLLKVSVAVITLPQRVKNSKIKDLMGSEQYLIVRDDRNKIEALKIINDSF